MSSRLLPLPTTTAAFYVLFALPLVQQNNWNDYRLATHADAPQIAVHIVPSAEPPTGIGECAVPAIAPALANAMAVLTGKRYRSLPFSA